MTILGWDIGGVNTKLARIANGVVRAAMSRPFEVQRSPGALVALLQELAAELDAPPDAHHALTMTAELSQMFRTKRDGVSFVLGAMQAAFPHSDVRVFTVNGWFVDVARGLNEPLSVAAANWAATAAMVAVVHRDALLVDIGTTTTDIIPIVSGRVAAQGRTDPERLASGELVYTGAVRTPVEAITSQVPFHGCHAGVSAEAFALAGDVHVWRGRLAPEDYNVPTPDGRPVTREFVRERLARVVCADREMLDDNAITAIAEAVASSQVARVADAIRGVLARRSALRTAVVTGVGAFIAEQAARAVGLDVVPLAGELGDAAARCAPAAAVGLLLEADLARSAVEVVVKIGGRLLAFPDHLERALQAVSLIARDVRVLIVPGGGLFADTVRDVDRRIGLSDDAAHWMAVLAMDQYAHVLAARLGDAVLVDSHDAIANALAGSRLPVLAPSRWLRAADPLPHSWDVTSDSVAAWVAGAVGAQQLVLMKPPRSGPDNARATATPLVDPYFERARSGNLDVTIVTADQLDASDFIATIMRLRATVR
jgi:probable H4MPT-linked C1 transfer pathway protein